MSDPAHTINRRLFEQFRQIAYRRAGIWLADGKETLVEARVSKRLRHLNLSSFGEYLKLLQSDDTEEELVQFLDAISTNFTSFFREPDHFDFLRDQLRACQQAGQSRFRIWCAAASTGEEPYSIAITALETLGAGADFKLLATDISTRALKIATAATYDASRLQQLTPARKRYFTKSERGPGAQVQQYTVNDEVRSLVAFRRLNLSVPPYPMKGPMDLVFCRNVIMYFDDEVRLRLMGEIVRLLKPEGYLLIGHSETIGSLNLPFAVLRPSIYRLKERP